MEVILLKDTEYGDKGASVKVADGFARNFLIPNGYAVQKTVGSIRHQEEINLHRKKKIDREKAEIAALAQKINALAPIVIKAKGGSNGVLFGSITNVQLAEEIKQALGQEIDKRRIALKQIKEAGLTDVQIKLAHGVTAIAKVKVELELDKADLEAGAKRKKPRKKSEILAEIEAKEAPAVVEVPAEEAAAPEAKEKKEKKPRKKKEAKE